MKLPRPVQIRHGTLGAYTNWGCRCRACTSASTEKGRRYRERDPERARIQARANHVERNYGITTADEERMLRDQGGLCLICQQPLDQHTRVIDHAHDTKQVRGILDRGCNLGLGKFKDDPQVLRRAARYVETGGQFGWEPGIGDGLL